MSCAACVRRVERAAAAVPGVAAVSVNLATGRAAVVPGPGFDAARLADALLLRRWRPAPRQAFLAAV